MDLGTAINELELREAAASDLIQFTKYTYPGYNAEAVHKLIGAHMDRVVDGTLKRLIVTIPPQTGKSRLGSNQLPAYWLGRRPDDPIIMASYAAGLAEFHSGLARDLVDSQAYKNVFPDVKLRHDSRSTEFWQISGHRGYMNACGVGGPITGKGCMCFPAGTMVTTEDGPIAIEVLVSMSKRPVVKSYNHKTNRIEWKRVVAVSESQANQLIRLTTKFGRQVTATAEHPIYLGTRGYISIKDAELQDTVYVETAYDYVVNKTVLRMVSEPVYDIQVEDNSNFFANEILVHNCAIVDDPIKDDEEARSPAVKEKVWGWYKRVLKPRVWHGGAIVILMTRWVEDDLVGRILNDSAMAKEGWTVLRVPALTETQEERDFNNRKLMLPVGEPDPLGRVEIESLCPERVPTEDYVLLSQGDKLTWTTLYQNAPIGLQGIVVNKDMFRFITQAPVCSAWVRYWDKAGTFGGGKFTAGVLLGIQHIPGSVGANIIVADVVRGQWESAEREAIIKETAQADRLRYGHVQVWHEQEPGSGGKDSAKATTRNLIGFAVESETVSGDKMSRARPFVSQIAANNVYLVIAPWNEAYIEEWTAIPNGRYTDQIDSSSGGLAHILEAAPATDPVVTGERPKLSDAMHVPATTYYHGTQAAKAQRYANNRYVTVAPAPVTPYGSFSGRKN